MSEIKRKIMWHRVTTLTETWVLGSYIPPSMWVFVVVPSGDIPVPCRKNLPRAGVAQSMIIWRIIDDTKTMTFATGTRGRRHLKYRVGWVVVGSDVVVGWDPMGYVPFDVWVYISWTLAPFGMIPIGPGSSSSKDCPTIIKIMLLTHLLTCPPLTTPPPYCSFISNIKTCDPPLQQKHVCKRQYRIHHSPRNL